VICAFLWITQQKTLTKPEFSGYTGRFIMYSGVREKKITKDEVERVRANFLYCPKKSTGTAAKDLWISKTTVWRVLRKRLVFTP
jgi:predicted DNA-binding protein (UPF0251 family)